MDAVSEPWMLAAAAAALVVAMFGSLCAAALLIYSPTKLAKLDGSPARAERLETHGQEYQVLARLLSIGGLIGMAMLLWTGAPQNRLPALLIGVAMAGLCCGELPGRIAEARAEAVASASLRLLEPLRLLLHWPLLRPYETISAGLLRILRIPTSPQFTDPDEIAEEILAAVSDSAQDADLPDEERSWIENIVELKDTAANEIMTPRTDMTAFPRELSLREAISQATEHGFSRYPVYQEDVDQIVGVFYAKDALSLLHDGETLDQRSVGDLMRPALFVPEGMAIVDLLRQLRGTQRGLAVVLDEYGGTAGVVSLEDVLEEIIGEIHDEYDELEAPELMIVEPGRVLELSGRARVSEANELLDREIPEHEDYDTVAGYVFTNLDRIPKVGETVQLDGVEVHILEGDDRRISRMRLCSKQPAETDVEGEPLRNGDAS